MADPIYQGLPVAMLKALPYVHYLLQPWASIIEQAFLHQAAPGRGKRDARMELFLVGDVDPDALQARILLLHREVRSPLFDLFVYGAVEWADHLTAPALARWVSGLTRVDLADGAGEQTPRALQDRYPYMFDSIHWDIGISKGWFSIFERVCAAIDSELGTERYRFRWVQVKEKFGTMRLHFQLGRRRITQESGARPATSQAEGKRLSRKRQEIFAALLAICREATVESAETCIICGQAGREHQTKNHWILTLCDAHIAQDNACEELPSAWFLLEEEPWFVSMAQLDFS